MPKPSIRSVAERYRSGSVRVFALDREGVLARLRERARALVDADPNVIAIRLFGSLARGDARPGSDADIVVEVEQCSLPALERAGVYQRAFEGIGVGCDLVVLTASERRDMGERGLRFARMLEEEGVVLAHR